MAIATLSKRRSASRRVHTAPTARPAVAMNWLASENGSSPAYFFRQPTDFRQATRSRPLKISSGGKADCSGQRYGLEGNRHAHFEPQPVTIGPHVKRADD